MRVAADLAVVAGEAAVLEHRVGEQVGGRHRHLEAGVGQGLLEVLDRLVAVRLHGEQVVVVEGHAIGPKLGQLVHGLDGVERGPGRVTELVARLPADSPQPECELVLGEWGCTWGASELVYVVD